MDARARAPRIKHHGVEDAAVVCWAAEAGEDAHDAVGQVQQRGPGLGPAQPCHSQQDQEYEYERHVGFHLLSGGRRKRNERSCR